MEVYIIENINVVIDTGLKVEGISKWTAVYEIPEFFFIAQILILV